MMSLTEGGGGGAKSAQMEFFDTCVHSIFYVILYSYTKANRPPTLMTFPQIYFEAT